MALSNGTKLGRYEIRSKLGEGGMGEVYLAHDSHLRRPIAIKLLPAKYGTDRERLHRLEQEACAASALNHPNILTVHEIGREDNVHYIATEFVDGVTLRQRLREGPMSLGDALDVAQQTAFALTAAHAAGVVHRDIKPENIMLRRDHVVKILDFGLAKLVEIEDSGVVDTEAQTRAIIKTDPGLVMGTARYMSPEQARGKEIDARSDVWSLGMVLYEMVTGRPPFEGETSSHVVVSILEHEPPALARFVPDAPAELERIVRKCLTKERDDRYQTARDLMIDLRNLRRELDLRSEIERSAAHSSYPPSQTFAGATSAHTKALTDVSPTQTSASSALSVEYVVTGLKRHKRIAVSIAALVAVAVVASILLVGSRRERTLTDKDTILLADFVNTTGDPVFDGTLKQALAVQLGQSPFLNVFSEDRVRATLRFMGREPEERVTREVGREISQRHGLKAMLVGSIANFGNHYVITLEVINAQTGDAIAREQVEAETKERVLRAVGEAATSLREKLGESLASIQKYDAPIEEATTASLDAFKSFSLGYEQQLKGKYFEAIPQYKRATELDPNFALAYARLASVYFNNSEYGLAAEASKNAYDLRDRVSERERLYISMGYYSNVTRELEKYIETLELWKRVYPRDVVPRNNLALQYNDIAEFEKAAEAAREAIALNPSAAAPHSNLARAFAGMNRFDEAKDVIARALAQKVESFFMHRTLYSIAFVQRDEAGMQQQIEYAQGKPEEYAAQNWQAERAASSGQLEKSRQFSKRAVELAQRRDLKEVVAQIVAWDAANDAAFSDCGQVKAKAAKAVANAESQPAMINAATALAGCGEFGQMKSITDELVKRYPKDTLLNKLFLPMIQARAEIHRRNATQAIQYLEMARTYERAALFQVPYLRGQSYLAQQKAPEAAAEFQKILDHRGWYPASPLYSLAYLGLARAAALQGDTAKARKAYQDFFALWKDADANVSVLIEARKEYDKLK